MTLEKPSFDAVAPTAVSEVVAGDRGVAAIQVQQPACSGRCARASAPGAVSPDHNKMRPACPAGPGGRGCNPSSRRFHASGETIAGHVEVVVALGDVLVLRFPEDTGPEPAGSQTKGGHRVTGDFDVGQPEHLSGDGFEPG